MPQRIPHLDPKQGKWATTISKSTCNKGFRPHSLGRARCTSARSVAVGAHFLSSTFRDFVTPTSLVLGLVIPPIYAIFFIFPIAWAQDQPSEKTGGIDSSSESAEKETGNFFEDSKQLHSSQPAADTSEKQTDPKGRNSGDGSSYPHQGQLSHQQMGATEGTAKEDRKNKETRSERKDLKDQEVKDSPWPQMELSIRLMTGWELERQDLQTSQGGDTGSSNDNPDAEQRFFLQQARVWIKAAMHKRLVANISADLSDAIRPKMTSDEFEQPPYLRNAYFNFRIKRAFQVRAGRFKRPFSRLENRSTGSLPFRGRGLSNSLIIEDSRFGDRAIGAMLWGKIRSFNLTWQGAVSNPEWKIDSDSEAQGLDAMGRLVYSPTKWLSVGGNYGHKVLNPPGSPPIRHTNALGGDMLLKISDFYFAAEVIAAQIPIQEETPFAMGVVAYANYDIELSQRLTLQPTLFGEYADANTGTTKTEATRAIVGLNILWDKKFRLLPQVELVRPLGTQSIYNPWSKKETYYLLVSLQI